MSMSAIYDALTTAADTLVLDGEAAWERALAAVEDLGGWDFDHYSNTRFLRGKSYKPMSKARVEMWKRRRSVRSGV